MLFHHLHEPHSGVDIEQLVCSIDDSLETDVLIQAVEDMVRRHDVLRTSFHWENSLHPVQNVHTQVHVPFDIIDWREQPAEVQQERLDAYLEDDRKTGFELHRAPLTRFALFRLSEQNYKLIWTFHHLLFDGRSFPIVLNELFGLYDAKRKGENAQLAPARPYGEFINWLDSLDDSRAEGYWRKALKGFSQTTPLVALDGAQGEAGHGEEEIRLSAEATESLRKLSAREGFTLNTVAQGAWALLLSRYTGSRDIVFGATRACRGFSSDAPSMVGTFINTLPVRVSFPDDAPLFSWLKQIRSSQLAVREYEHTSLTAIQSWSEVPAGTPLFESILVFDNYLLNSKLQSQGGHWGRREVHLIERTNYPLTLYGYGEPELIFRLAYDKRRFNQASALRMLGHLKRLLEAIAADVNCPLSDLPILTCGEERQLLHEWNNTLVDYSTDKRLHDLIEEQVRRSPDATAVIFRDQRLTYGELDRKANQLARFLVTLGVGPGVPVGICVKRSLDLMVALLATLKAGGAYLPLDPTYPADRMKFVLSDARVPIVLTEENLRSSVAEFSARVIAMDTDLTEIEGYSTETPAIAFPSDNLAYVIYTSGSTGKPKGVMVTHRNVVNFFKGMDQTIGEDAPGVWLAVTSISFDISVLELFWTLSRGFRVVLQEESYDLPTSEAAKAALDARPIEFGLFYFASDENSAGEKYRLLIEGAKFADQGGFTSIWTPERHFHAFGGLFPNPAVTGAALAMITRNLQIRAGSVVLPLHDPIRVAEEWAVVDQLSHGRAGVSFASGWHDRDFVFAPENYAERKKVMIRELETVRSLWRGDAVVRQAGSGNDVNVRIFPRPVQSELPVWITAGGDPQTFQMAGQVGANLLTHLLGQTMEELETKIALYRNAFSKQGGTGRGHVTLMLHTFVGERDDEVEEVVRTPFCNYLKSSIDLMKQVARGLGEEITSGVLSEQDLASLIEHAFHRYFATSGLFGTPETCLTMVRKLKQIGVDEVACLIDFGIEIETVLANLKNLRELAANSNRPAQAGYSIPEQVFRHGVTHMQCTPSLARILANAPAGREAIGSLGTLLIGGEAFPASLAAELRETGVDRIYNMYGPTETTIWSTMDRVGTSREIPIGRPIANTSVFVLDSNQRLVPVGVPGELYIGGDGVVRGYLDRPDLTAQKFTSVPYPGGERVYRTGDLVKYLPDGRLHFLGRVDHQVKIRGHRIELEEIEATLCRHPGIQAALVSAVDDEGGGKALIAHLIKSAGELPLPTMELRNFLGTKLPSYMIPSAFAFWDAFPLTPNGKIDRNQMPNPNIAKVDREIVPPRDPIEEKLAAVWREALRINTVGVYDNFFDLGGHSLSAVKVTARIRTAFSVALPLQTVLDNPTIAQLSVELQKFLGTSAPQQSLAPPPIVRASSVRGRREVISTYN